jgi:uncharacterized protein involved in tellurium resistance
MNRDFEFKQLLRAYRAGIVTEQTFEAEMAALVAGSSGKNGSRGFTALGHEYGSEKEGVAAMLDRFRAGEANGEVAFTAWAKLCNTDCIRSGLRMIAEREAYHARIFERRMRDLGLECKAQVNDQSRKITETLSDPNTSDNQKLLYLNSLLTDVDAFFKPILQIAEDIQEDLESKELFKLFVEDELSSTKWLKYACAALNGASANPAAQAGVSAESMMRA